MAGLQGDTQGGVDPGRRRRGRPGGHRARAGAVALGSCATISKVLRPVTDPARFDLLAGDQVLAAAVGDGGTSACSCVTRRPSRARRTPRRPARSRTAPADLRAAVLYGLARQPRTRTVTAWE